MVKEVTVPDIGDFASVDVIEILVAPGDKVAIDDPLITLESDKASMDIPAPFAGTVQEIKTAVGEQVSEGDVIVLMVAADVTETVAEAADSDNSDEQATAVADTLAVATATTTSINVTYFWRG